jgi:hypothetical protein
VEISSGIPKVLKRHLFKNKKLLEILLIPTIAMRRQASRSSDGGGESQESLNEMMGRTGLGSRQVSSSSVVVVEEQGAGGNARARVRLPAIQLEHPIKIAVCFFKDIRKGEIFAPQNTIFVFTEEHEGDVRKKLRNIEKTAKTQGIQHEIKIYDVEGSMPPTVVGGLTSGFINKPFKDDANAWGIKRPRSPSVSASSVVRARGRPRRNP